MIRKLHDIFRIPVILLRQKLSDRQFFIFSSVVVGITSGFAAVVLKYFVHSIERIVDRYTVTFHEFFLFALLPLVGLVAVGLIVQFILRESPKKGSAEIVYAITKKSAEIAPSEMFSHVVTSAITVALGGSVGLEAPMVNTGAAIGSNYGSTYNLSYRDKTILLACGAAGGIAAAFNAPIAGVLFAVEILLTDVSASAFVPLIIAAASGALVSKIVFSEGVILSFSLQEPFNYQNVPFYVVLGVFAGIVSLFYARSFVWMEGTMMIVKNRWLRTLTGGMLLFSLLYFFPPLYGEGYETIKALASLTPAVLVEKTILQNVIVNNVHLILFLTALMLLKSVAAAITLGKWWNGWKFRPVTFCGRLHGFCFCAHCQPDWPWKYP
jgi:chloride channel protein, CIC family